MGKIYLPGDKAHLVYTFTDNTGRSVQADGDVEITVGGQNGTSLLLEKGIATLTISDTNTSNLPHVPLYSYVYDLPLEVGTPLCTYMVEVTGTVAGTPRTLVSELVVGGAYVTPKELRESKVGFDFTTYTDEQLNYAILFSKEMINSYCDRQWGVGTVVQKGETIVDNLGRIYLRFKSKPVERVTYLKVRVPASVGIELTPSYLDLFSEQGYGYYPISTAYGASAVGTYPLIVLGYMDKLLYRVEYEVESNIPFLIKHASILVCQNVLNADYYYNELGIANVIGPVTSFKSGSYNVAFDTSGTYKGKGYTGGQFLTPDVQEILDRFKVMKNNSMF